MSVSRCCSRSWPSCVMPGCTATRGLHAHHIVHWENGGATELSNLVLLFYESSQIRAASVVAVLLMICMLVGVIIALRVVDVRRLGVER